MKNRNIIIAAFLCLSMLVVGVGYATLTGHLTMEGSASYNKDAAEDGFIENIVFENAKVDKSGSAKSDSVQDEASANGNTATFTVRTLAAQNETAVFTYTLTNNNTVDANITINATHEDGFANPTDFKSENYYKVTSVKVDSVAYVTDQEANETATYTLNSGESVTVTVEVELVRTPAVEVTPENFYLHLTATSVDAQ